MSSAIDTHTVSGSSTEDEACGSSTVDETSIPAQGNAPLVSESGPDMPRLGSRQVTKMTYEDQQDLQQTYSHIRACLHDNIIDRIKKELLANEPARKRFIYGGYSDDADKVDTDECDDDDSYIDYEELSHYSVLSLAELVPEAKAERVLCKWLGKTERDWHITLAALGQMKRNYWQNRTFKEVPISLLRYWNLEYEDRKATFTIADAKDVCNNWYPVYRGQEAYVHFPSPGELSSAVKRTLDVFQASLKPGKTLLSRY